jgi:hypothetical protein
MEMRFPCCFELPHKGIYLEVTTNPESDNVDFSAFQDHEFMVSVCLRENQVDALIGMLQDFKNKKMYQKRTE